MKRILLIFLILTLLTTNVFCFAQDDKAEDNTTEAEAGIVELSADYDKEAFKLLSFLGVMSEQDMQNDKAVTRQEFVNMVGKLAGITAGGTTNYYDDVDKGNMANSFVDFGYLKVGEDKLFRPSDNVTTIESYYILLRVLGYEEYVNAAGGSEYDYLKMAKRIELSISDNLSKELSLSEVCNLLFNTLKCSVYEPTSFSEDSVKYSEGKPLLEELYNIVCIEGIFAATGNVSVYKNVKAPGENGIVVGETMIKCDDMSIADGIFLGCDVKVYAKKEDNSYVAAVMIQDYRNCEVYEFTSEDAPSTDGRKVTFEVDGKKQKYELNMPTFILNGKVDYNAGVEDILNYIKRDNLDIVLIDNSERADIEFVAINEYVDAEVTVNNAKDGLIYAKDANDEVHKLPITAATGDVDLVRIYDAKTGSEESAESIKPGNLISFCKSTDGRVITIYNCTNSVRGQIGITEIQNDELYATVNEVRYHIASKLLFGSLDRNVQLSFILNKIGKVVKITSSEDAWHLGYIYDLTEVNLVFEEVYEFMVYTDEKKLEQIRCADRYTLDGVRRNDGKFLAERISDSSGAIDEELRLIRYKRNGNGEFVELDTATRMDEVPEGENTLTVIGHKLERKYCREANYANIYVQADIKWVNSWPVTNPGETRTYSYPLNLETKIFTVPEDTSRKPEDYDFSYSVIGNGYSIRGESYHKYAFYSVNSDSDRVDVMIEYLDRQWEPSLKSDSYLINDVSIEASDKDGTKRKCIQVKATKYHSTETKQIMLESSVELTDVRGNKSILSDTEVVERLSPGDVINLGGSKNGLIAHIKVLYDYDADDPNSSDDDNRGQVYWGWVNEKGEPLSTYTYRYTNVTSSTNMATEAMGAYGYLYKRIFDVNALNQHEGTSNKGYVVLGEAGTEGSDVIAGSYGWLVGYGRFTAFDSSRRENPAYYSVFTDAVDYQSSQTEYDYVLLLSDNTNTLSYSVVFYRRKTE